MTLKVVSPQDALNSNDQLSTVDQVVRYLNAALCDPLRRNAARSTPEVGGFYQFVLRQALTKEDVRELTGACHHAGWASVSVAAFNDSVSISLHPSSTFGWKSYHQGVALAA